MIWKKLLAILGTALAWLPILAMLGTGLVVTLRSGMLRIDYLLPAELGLLTFSGALLLLVTAFLTRMRRLFFGWGVGLMLTFLLLGVLAAVLTGLASGAYEATGWRLVLVAGLMIGYDLVVLMVAVGGISFALRLFRKVQEPAGSQAN